MARLIEADKLKDSIQLTNPVEEYASLDLYKINQLKKWIDSQPTVEAIPKADYENRLKADLAAMLRFLWNDIENLDAPICDYASSDCISKWQVHEIIQQRIVEEHIADTDKMIKPTTKDDSSETRKKLEKSEWEHDHKILKAHSDGANDMLDKIRAEIKKAVWEDVIYSCDGADEVRIPRLEPDDVFEIIDKYKAEFEPQESEYLE